MDRAVALVTPAECDVAEATATDGSHHRGEVDDGCHGCRQAQQHSGKRFRNKHFADDLPPGRAKRMGGLAQPGIHLFDRNLNHAREEGNGDEGKRHNSCGAAEEGAHHKTGERDDGDHQDNEGDAASEVHHKAQDRVENTAQPALTEGGVEQAATFGAHEQNTKRETHNDRKKQREAHHVQRLAGAGDQHINEVAPESGAGCVDHAASPSTISTRSPWPRRSAMAR